MRVAIIITTYNWPEALAATLTSIGNQTRKPDRIIVADDGSGNETSEVVEQTLGPLGMEWLQVRHEDKGIRQARVKNLAVKHAESDYLIFVDHDVVLHDRFIEDHLSMCGQGIFLQGKRAFLPGDLSGEVLKNGLVESPCLYRKGLGNRKNALRCPGLGRVLARKRRFQTSLRGCNLSMTYHDFKLVDGYDEVFDAAWGREDSDICYRLFHNGIRCRNLWFMALQYHLHHPVKKNRLPDILDTELGVIRKEKRKKAVKGFSKLSSEGGVVQKGDL
jgi:glycosyltransferase involved in cell wall biosynthesis